MTKKLLKKETITIEHPHEISHSPSEVATLVQAKLYNVEAHLTLFDLFCNGDQQDKIPEGK